MEHTLESLGIDGDVMHDCPECGEKESVNVSMQNETFLFGGARATDTEKVELSAFIPVWTCGKCGFGYIDVIGMDLKHEAICAHLRCWSPREIREFRARHELEATELAKLMRLDENTLAKLERGAVWPNPVYDRFMRLIDDAEVIAKLRRTA